MDNSVIYSGQNLQNLEKVEAELKKKAKSIIYLDLSNNIFQDFKVTFMFSSLQILMLDQNKITTIKNFPQIKTLDTLSLNDNSISSLNETVSSCIEKFPNIKFLNSLRNPMNPNFENLDQYKKYRSLYKQIKSMENLDGISFQDESVLECYRNVKPQQISTSSQPLSQSKLSTHNKEKNEEKIVIKLIEEEDEYQDESGDKKYLVTEDADELDLQNILKQKKRQSTITYSQRILKKADNLTKFNRKNHSEGNKHISNSDL